MSSMTHRPAATDHIDFRIGERAGLMAWADEHGLEVSITPAGPDHAEGMIFVGLEDGGHVGRGRTGQDHHRHRGVDAAGRSKAGFDPGSDADKAGVAAGDLALGGRVRAHSAHLAAQSSRAFAMH